MIFGCVNLTFPSEILPATVKHLRTREAQFPTQHLLARGVYSSDFRICARILLCGQCQKLGGNASWCGSGRGRRQRSAEQSTQGQNRNLEHRVFEVIWNFLKIENRKSSCDSRYVPELLTALSKPAILRSSLDLKHVSASRHVRFNIGLMFEKSRLSQLKSVLGSLCA
jgi:hypothetical protein